MSSMHSRGSLESLLSDPIKLQELIRRTSSP